MKNNNKIYSLLTILLSFFILVFFTTNIYSTMQENFDIKVQKQQEIEKLDKKLKELNSVKQNFKNKKLNLNKFTNTFDEAEIFKYINKYIETVNNTYGDVVLEFGNISFSKPEKSELGFKEVKINLKLNKVKNSKVMMDILDYLVSDKNKYSFFITDFSFPIERSGPYKGISIPLKMYVK